MITIAAPDRPGTAIKAAQCDRTCKPESASGDHILRFTRGNLSRHLRPYRRCRPTRALARRRSRVFGTSIPRWTGRFELITNDIFISHSLILFQYISRDNEISRIALAPKHDPKILRRWSCCNCRGPDQIMTVMGRRVDGEVCRSGSIGAGSGAPRKATAPFHPAQAVPARVDGPLVRHRATWSRRRLLSAARCATSGPRHRFVRLPAQEYL